MLCVEMLELIISGFEPRLQNFNLIMHATFMRPDALRKIDNLVMKEPWFRSLRDNFTASFFDGFQGH